MVPLLARRHLGHSYSWVLLAHREANSYSVDQ